MAASSAVGSSSRALAHVMASTQAPGPGGGAPSGVATAQAPVTEQVHLPPAAKRNANGPDAEVTEAGAGQCEAGSARQHGEHEDGGAVDHQEEERGLKLQQRRGSSSSG